MISQSVGWRDECQQLNDAWPGIRVEPSYLLMALLLC